MSAKLIKALTDAGADLIGIVATWLIVSLSIQGITFDSLFTQKSLIGLTIAVAVYVANWVKNYRRTGDFEPPIPVAAQINDIQVMQEHIMDTVGALAVNVTAIQKGLADSHDRPPLPPPVSAIPS